MHLAQKRVSTTSLLYENNIELAAYTLSKNPVDVAFSDDALAVYRWCEHSMRHSTHNDMGVLHLACLLATPRPDAEWDAFAATQTASRAPWKEMRAAETRAQMIEAVWDWLGIIEVFQVDADSIMRRVVQRRFRA